MVICLERVVDLHMSQLTPLPLTASSFSKIQIGFTFLVMAYLGSPGKGPLNGCVIRHFIEIYGASVAEWLACWTEAQKGLGSNRSRYAVG